MRVTQSMISRTVVNNINRNLERLSRAQEQMSSGKVVSRPSDDPIALARIMILKSTLSQDEQYTKNMEDAIGWLDTSESALNSATAALQRARELTIYGANGSLSETDRQALAKEVDELIDELVAIANTSYGGQYIFGGQETLERPFERGSVYLDTDTDGNGDSLQEVVIYHGNNINLDWEVSPRVTVAPNVTGSDVFSVREDYASPVSGDPVQDAAISDLFATLFELKDALEQPGTTFDPSALQTVLGDLDNHLDNILNWRASLGARSNRLNMGKNRAAEANIKQTGLLSRLEDVDLAKASMDYAIASYVYQASLNTGAKVLQPSLVDYLR